MTHRPRAPKQQSWPRIRSRFRTHQAAADELFTLMDDAVAGRGKEDAPEHVAPEVLVTAYDIQQTLADDAAHLSTSQQQHIWEEIMSSTSPTASFLFPTPSRRGRAQRVKPVIHGPVDHPYRAARPFINIAFAVVLVVAIIGGAKAWRTGGGSGAPPRQQLAAPLNPEHPLATPNGTPAACAFNCDYSLNAPPIFWSFQTGIAKQYLASADLGARDVQLLDWKIAPGGAVTMPADGEGGVIVDTLVDGAAVMTIDGPATIIRRNDPVRGFYAYPKAGEKVELSRGDTIVYSATHKRTIANPLDLITLHTKSAVFFNGDAARFQPSTGTPRVTVNVNGERAMDQPLSSFLGAGSDFTFVLNYIQIYPGTELPVERGSLTRVLGPVDALAGPAGTEGYVIWLGPAMG